MTTTFGQDLIASMGEALAFSNDYDTGARVHHIKVPVVDVTQSVRQQTNRKARLRSM